MFGLIGWVIIGLLAGLLARAIMPGKQQMGCLLTMVLGIVGSLVGGFVSSLIFGHKLNENTIHASGLIMSTIGAVIVLAIYGAMQKRRPPV
jgi:uncharacterized membrane protein YeaQ/YmgE (transglycosylase-associated protein family)